MLIPSRTDVSLETHNGGITSPKSPAESFEGHNGGVVLKRVGGSVRGGTTNGGLVVELDGSRWDGEELDVHTTNGGIVMSVPDNYSAHLETGTVNGHLSIDFPVTVQGRITRELAVNLGSGGATVRAMTTNGGVRIKRAGAETDFKRRGRAVTGTQQRSNRLSHIVLSRCFVYLSVFFSQSPVPVLLTLTTPRFHRNLSASWTNFKCRRPPLQGAVSISGAKNSALPCMAAALLSRGDRYLHNIPYVRDIITQRRLLEDIGATVLTPELRTHKITASHIELSKHPTNW